MLALFRFPKLTLQVFGAEKVFAFGTVGVRGLLDLFKSFLAGVLVFHEACYNPKARNAPIYFFGFGVGVGEAAVRYDVLLFVPLTVVAAFGLGVGVGLVFAVRPSLLLFDPWTVTARSCELLFPERTVVVR